MNNSASVLVYGLFRVRTASYDSYLGGYGDVSLHICMLHSLGNVTSSNVSIGSANNPIPSTSLH